MAGIQTVQYDELKSGTAPCEAGGKQAVPAVPSLSTIATEDDESVPSTELESTFDSDSASELSSLDADLDDDAAFSPEDTLLIFDWDDTILPSHWMREQGLELGNADITEAQRSKFEALAERAAETLRSARSHGEVLLVTNAESGWVELTCAQFMPTLGPALKGLRVLSARSTYEAQGVASPSEWKRLAFEREIGGFCDQRAAGQQWKNIISIGDSPHEREALISATELLSDCCVKSVKFAEKPDVDLLLREHELIGGCLRHIVQRDGNLDLCIQ